MAFVIQLEIQSTMIFKDFTTNSSLAMDLFSEKYQGYGNIIDLTFFHQDFQLWVNQETQYRVKYVSVVPILGSKGRMEWWVIGYETLNMNLPQYSQQSVWKGQFITSISVTPSYRLPCWLAI